MGTNIKLLLLNLAVSYCLLGVKWLNFKDLTTPSKIYGDRFIHSMWTNRFSRNVCVFVKLRTRIVYIGRFVDQQTSIFMFKRIKVIALVSNFVYHICS
jgi:hypothetical protein